MQHVAGRRLGTVKRHTRPGTRGLVAVIGILAAITTTSHATHKVYSPHVEEGELELEVRGHVDFDDDDDLDDAHAEKYEIGYAFTDWWLTSVFLEYEKEPRGHYGHASTAWENIFQLTEEGRYWLDFGLYVEYKDPAGSGPQQLELKGLFEKQTNRFVNSANLIFEREIGNNASSDIEVEYAWRTRYELRQEFRPALELYGELGELDGLEINGDQQHQAGPVASGKFSLGKESSVSYEFGYLFGLTDDSPDGTLKWLLEFEYEF
jgi:hypothetical protein